MCAVTHSCTESQYNVPKVGTMYRKSVQNKRLCAEAMPRPGIARRTGPVASWAPQGIPLAKFRPSVDMSTVVRSKRTSKCRDVLFETKFMAPTWPKQAVAAAAAWLPRSRGTCRAAWVAERTSWASSDGGRRPRAPLRPPMQLRARTTIYEDFSKQPARSSSRPRAGWEPAPVAHGLRAGSARPVPWLDAVVRTTRAVLATGAARACPCAHCICMDACLACVHVDAGGSSACRELPAMAAEYAGHSAACRMHARAIDGVSRVCTVLRITFVTCPRWCREMWFLVWRPPRRMRLWGSVLYIYLVYIQA